MLSLQEALLFKAVQEEQANQEAQQAAGILGAVGGGALGVAGGAIPHSIGRSLNNLRGGKPNPLKPGFRMAGGLTGALLGGALGAGAAVLAKENEAGRLLGKIQATGEVDEIDKMKAASILSELYSNPSQLM